MRSAARQLDKGAIELIEEAVHLLRRAPMPVLAGYYAGSLPFVLALLYFWADMSRSPLAYEHLAGGAWGLGALFVWMKFCHSVFGLRLRAVVAGQPPPVLGLRRCRRILTAQSALQSSGLFLLPLSLVLTLPFAWVYAFYQNLAVLDDGEGTTLRGLIQEAQKQALPCPRQNHFLLAILFAFGVFVFLNWSILCLVLPGLVKTLFGVETMFSRSVFSLLNTTFFAVMLGLTYLCVDPISKACYVLRCFYGQSRRSGEDLKAELRQLKPLAAQIAACVALALLLLQPGPLSAAEKLETSKPRWKEESQRDSASKPRVARDELPWVRGGVVSPTLKGLRQFSGSEHSNNTPQPFQGWNSSSRLPRVARPSQPWAGGLNPCGIEDPYEETTSLALSNSVRVMPYDYGGGAVAETRLERRVNQGQGQRASGPTVPSPPQISPSSPSAPELDRNIQEVLQQQKYTWRMPREKIEQPETGKGLLGRFFERVRQWLRSLRDWVSEWLRRIFLRHQKSGDGNSSGYGWILTLQILLELLAVAVIVALAILIFRILTGKRRKPVILASEPIQPAPDVSDENVGADQLPEDGWTTLGRELLERGELRLALRAFYLGSLAHLASRQLISLARFKSNRDYERELRRRGHSFPELLSGFGENVLVFDRIWYGAHEINRDLVQQFLARVEQMRGQGL